MTTKLMQKSLLSEFWNWFVENANRITPDIADANLLASLDEKVTAINPGFSWEIGPGQHSRWQFVLSPNLDKDLLQASRIVIAAAPSLADWEFHFSRQPKEWNFEFDLRNEEDGIPLHINAIHWTFVLLKYPDGLREILLSGSFPQMKAEQRWQAAAIVLESILGEELMMANVDDFHLVPDLEPRFAARKRPLGNLLSAVIG